VPGQRDFAFHIKYKEPFSQGCCSLASIPHVSPTLPLNLSIVFSKMSLPRLGGALLHLLFTVPVAQRLLYRHITISACPQHNAVPTLARGLTSHSSSDRLQLHCCIPHYSPHLHLLATAIRNDRAHSLNISSTPVSVGAGEGRPKCHIPPVTQLTCAFPSIQMSPILGSPASSIGGRSCI